MEAFEAGNGGVARTAKHLRVSMVFSDWLKFMLDLTDNIWVMSVD